ncbi:MAG: nitroreductase family protein [Prolixibacteraceae bacterium]|nr:nitroreductase family protein [Prolixibacteraceae bacterium]
MDIISVNTLKNTLQKFLAYKNVRRFFRYYYILLLGIASSNRLFSIIYHFITFYTFSREQHANIRARYHYYLNINNTKGKSHPGLRRNTHRLEKGLLMRPPRKSFALSYIGETLDFYEKRIQQYKEDPDGLDKKEIKWSTDVLTKYFNTVELNDYLAGLKKRFESLDSLYFEENEKMIPYNRDAKEEKAINYEDLYALSLKRRSVRWFQQKKVPRDLIDKALMVARQSPSACNRLPYEFRIYDDPEWVRKIAQIPFGASGYADNIPTLVVLTGQLNYYFSARDRHVIYIDASLSAMAFMYALETLGLSSSVINWPDFEFIELKMQKLLNLSIDERPVMLIAVGYPDPKGEVAYSCKKSLDAFRSYNKF